MCPIPTDIQLISEATFSMEGRRIRDHYHVPEHFILNIPAEFRPYLQEESHFCGHNAFNLAGGLQDGDLELFLGERVLEHCVFSTGQILEEFFRENPDERKKALSYIGTWDLSCVSSVLNLILHVYGLDFQQEDDCWKFIIYELPQFQWLKDKMLYYENREELFERLQNIRKKIARMPFLNEAYCIDGGIIVADKQPGHFKAKDCALLGVLGILVGVVVLRASDAFKYDVIYGERRGV